MKRPHMNTYILTCLSVLAALASSQADAQLTFEQELQQGCAKVQHYALAGKKYYDQKQYQKALAQFKDQAAWTSFCLINSEESGIKLSDRDGVIANNNVGLSYAKLNQPLWARAWFMRDAKSPQSQFNLKALALPKNSTQLHGSYVSPSGFAQWNTIKVQKSKTSYHIHFEGYYFPLRGLIYGPNLGAFDINMPIDRQKAVYQYENCQIALSFAFDGQRAQHIVVTQNSVDADCGFGHNVSAMGHYLKVE